MSTSCPPDKALQITNINLRNFRSYDKLSLDGLGSLTVFVGPNAAGKTNIIEAIQMLTALTSFRGATSAEMIQQSKAAADENTAHAQIHATDGNRELDIELLLAERSRKYKLNGKPKRAAELRGLLPAVTFTPDDLDLAKGSNGIRRRALDTLGVQLNANYRQILRDFEKMLTQKNALLKEEVSLEVLEAVNYMFEKVGSQLSGYRSHLFQRLLPHITSLYSEISGNDEEASGQYIAASFEDADPAEEIRCGRALAGPHLDKVQLFINGLDASKFASQGQQRSLVLAWKLAEVALIEEMLGTLPVLLLDDVMSELDENRREALVSHLQNGSQTFVTTANMQYFDKEMLRQAEIIQLPFGDSANYL